LPISKTALPIVLLLLLPRILAAQETSTSETAAASVDVVRQWEPIGPAPVDQAGAGLRGYSLPVESSEVIAAGSNEVSFQTVASNNFYREQNSDFLITQRYETHTVALGYRHGSKFWIFPRVEIGGQIQLAERDSGFLNGFISAFEGFAASVSGQQSAQLRANLAQQPPLGTAVAKNGQPIYQAPGRGSGFGDMSLVAKALLRNGSVSSGGTSVAARVAVNISGQSPFTAGNFVGGGVGIDKRLTSWLAVNGDLRATVFLDRVSVWSLPLKRGSVGFSGGSEMKLTRNNSLNVQIDGSSTPFLPTGTLAFDAGYGDITIGYGHRSAHGGVFTQVYVRENMNLPFRIRWNLDPDLALGIKTTIRLSPTLRGVR
jgi:hypothetical protein